MSPQDLFHYVDYPRMSPCSHTKGLLTVNSYSCTVYIQPGQGHRAILLIFPPHCLLCNSYYSGTSL